MTSETTTHTDMSAEDRVRLKYIRASNLRSLKHIELAIEPTVTVLVGPNASGKSTIIDAMSFVYDALYDGVERAVGYRGTRAILHRHRGYVSRAFSVGLGLESPAFSANHEFTIRITLAGEVSIAAERISGRVKGPRGRGFDFRLKDGTFHKPAPPNVANELPEMEPSSDYLMLSVMGDSLGVAHRLTSSLLSNQTKSDPLIAQSVVDMTNFIGDMRFYRLFPNTMREPTRPSPSDQLEEDGANLASVLRRLVRQRSEAYYQLIAALNYVVPDIQDAAVRQVGGYQYILLKHRSLTSKNGEGGWLDISNESDGTVRTLALLVALYQDPSPSLICIEEPELNVHVGALGVLADTLNEVGLRSQVVVTTHSSDLLDYCQHNAFRAVINEEGRTKAAGLSKNQVEALRETLFSAGELHRMEGLSIDLEGE